MLLLEYVPEHILSTHVCPKYRRALELTVGCFGRHLGHSPTIEDLCDRSVNSYLASLESSHARATVKGERARLLALWRSAFDAELTNVFPRRVRKVFLPDKHVEAWGEKELHALQSRCSRLKGYFKNRWRVARRDYGSGIVQYGYNAGTRLGDIEQLKLSDLGTDGSIYWVQSKTGIAQGVLLWPETIEAIMAVASPDREYVFGGVLNRRYFYRWMKRIIKESGLTGTFRWIRRSSGSLVERDHPGWGHKHLGNTPEVFRKHYEDKRITSMIQKRPLPPRLFDRREGA